MRTGRRAAGRGGGGAGMTLDAFKTNAQRRFGDAADEYVKLYGVTSDAEAQPAAHDACADEINWNMRQWAAAQAKMGKKAYTYFFTRIPTLNGQPSPQGATHTAEISYAFNNPKGQANQTWNDVDTKLADRCRRTGSTSSPRAIPTARACRTGRNSGTSNSKVMVFGDMPQAEPAAPAPKLAFYSGGVSASAQRRDELVRGRRRAEQRVDRLIRAVRPLQPEMREM